MKFLSHSLGSYCLGPGFEAQSMAPQKSGPVVTKKTMSPCSIWQGLWAAAQEKRSKYKGFSMYSMNKTGGSVGQCLKLGQIWQVDWAAAEHLLFFFKYFFGGFFYSSSYLLSSYSSPFFRVKWLYDYGLMKTLRWAEKPTGNISRIIVYLLSLLVLRGRGRSRHTRWHITGPAQNRVNFKAEHRFYKRTTLRWPDRVWIHNYWNDATTYSIIMTL